MSLQTIRNTVAQLVPEARDIRTREAGGNVYALLAEVGDPWPSLQGG